MAVRSVRREKFKFKWTKELIFLIVGLLAVIITTICLALPTKEDKFLAKWEAAQLPRKAAVSELSESSVLDKINNSGEYVFVFYGTPEDETSVTNIKTVETTAKAFDIKNVYCIDATEVFETTDEVKNTKDFKDKIDSREEALGGVDLLKYGSFWVYNEKGELVLDSTTFDNGETFVQIVTKGFGDFKALPKK